MIYEEKHVLNPVNRQRGRKEIVPTYSDKTSLFRHKNHVKSWILIEIQCVILRMVLFVMIN